jgi:DNA-binding CsgD family transcriptional regulator
MNRANPDRKTLLTPREFQVMSRIAKHWTNREIAADLGGISQRAVVFHVSNIMTKARVRRRSQLILLWYQGVIE